MTPAFSCVHFRRSRSDPVSEDQLTESQWLNLFEYFRNLPGQRKGLLKLREEIIKADPSILVHSAGWLDDYRTNPSPIPNPLKVPYEYQLNNSSGSGYRECFSSSCAMLAKFHGAVSSDDEYNEIRQRFGDSTSGEAQLRALRHLGLNAAFYTTGKPINLFSQLQVGLPVAVGWLHKGPVSAPSGGGHWTVIIGYDDVQSGLPRTWIHHDPNGEADLVNGGYVKNGPTDGKAIRYSAKNWEPRWMPGGTPGWYLTCSK